MDKIILTICIPTYNRAKILSETLKYNIQCPSKEIEFLISDNNSSDNTEEVVKSLGDLRIHYYRNDKNLGYDSNILKCVERAKGDFLFFLSDEDILDLDAIQWILETIKNNKNVTQIIGSVGDNRPGRKKIYYNPGKRILKPGYESLTNIFFASFYLSGIVMKRDTIDIKQAKNYVGMMYIHQVILTQNLIEGYTICTPRFFCYISAKQLKSQITMEDNIYFGPGLPYAHPLSRINLVTENIRIIKQLMYKFPKAQQVLLKKQILWAASYFKNLFFSYPYHFFNILIKFFNHTLIFESKRLIFHFCYRFIYELLYHIKLLIM